MFRDRRDKARIRSRSPALLSPTSDGLEFLLYSGLFLLLPMCMRTTFGAEHLHSTIGRFEEGSGTHEELLHDPAPVARLDLAFPRCWLLTLFAKR